MKLWKRVIHRELFLKVGILLKKRLFNLMGFNYLTIVKHRAGFSNKGRSTIVSVYKLH